jgi:hypothetical protein
MTAPQTTSASYEVGYRKPPRHTQFQKGQSGNPGGRPRRSRVERLNELALYEAYRTTIVMEDGHAVPMPVIQAVLRRQLQSAAGGNVRAQRDILAMIRDIERIRSIASLFEDGGADRDDDVVDDVDANGAVDSDVDDTADENDVVDETDDADTNGGDRNGVDDGADAGHDDTGGADYNEPARQQAEGIDAYGERRQEERERTAPLPAAGAPQPGNAAASPAGRTPLLPSGSERGQREGVLPRRTGPGRSAGVQPARPQPGRRRRNPAANAGDVRGGRSGGSRRSPGRTRPGTDDSRGTPARRPPLLNETKN